LNQQRFTKSHSFYPLVDSIDRLRAILPSGVRCVQLRVKELAGQELLDTLKSARQLCEENACLLIVNDHWQAAIETNCHYVHLGQEDLDTADIAALKAANIQIGISTHDDSELQRALSLEPDYVALGPIYPTQSKSLHWAAQGLAKVTEWKTRIGPIPLVAIGGISLDRASAVLAAGADSVAVIGAIVNAPDPLLACREWLAVCDRQT